MYTAIQAVTKYVVVGKDGSVVREFTKNEAGKLLLTSSKYRSDIDITGEYKDEKAKIPDTKPSKIQVELNVEKTVGIGRPIKYQVKVANTSPNSHTVMCLSLELRNQFGKNVLEEPLTRSLVFTDKDTTLEGAFEIDLTSASFDFTTSSVYWGLRVFDADTNRFKTVVKNSSIEPLFEGSVKKVDKVDSSDKCAHDIEVQMKNNSSLKLEGVRIVVLMSHSNKLLKEEWIHFEPLEAKKLEFHLENMSRGYKKIRVCASYGATFQEVGSLKYVSF
ncbi:hypothetical protein RF11_06662 [Thelohanellus kitauei]|uniref:Uncharacterized protein n=1 Tax=Thelohanellus kitauei TaxID=669202 RepID=A0A0C2IEE6_THEKT|nr:hypothetical protein RF11_06662 [Thelohanellus kitauei]